MSEKIWYIYEKDHHVGPFDESEIAQMLDSERIQSDTMIWKEGNESWAPLERIESLNHLLPQEEDEEELPPPLPPLPVEKEEEVLEFSLDSEQPREQDEATDEIQVTITEDIQDHGDFETFGTYQNTANGPLKRINWKKAGKWLLGIVSILIVALGIFWLFWDKGERPTFSNLLANDRQRLLQTSMGDSGSELKVSFALSKNGEQLWMASNQHRQAQVHLRLTSLKGKILATDKVIITTQGFLKRGVAKFSKYKMEQGRALIPGAYTVEIFGHFMGLHSKMMTFLQDIKIFNFLSFVGNYSTKFKYRRDFLLISGSKVGFEEQLKRFLSKLHSKKIKPLQDMIERYRTYTALLERIIVIYKEQLKKYRTGYSVVKSFEKSYAIQVAPLLEFVLLDNNKIHVYLVDAEALIASEYEVLLTFGKQVGEFVSDLSTVTKKYRKLTLRRKKKLDQQFSDRVKKLEQLSSSRLSKLERKLSKWKTAVP